MIASIRHKGLKRFYETGNRAGLDARMIARIEEVLSVLDAAESVEEMNLPGYRLHALTGNLHGYWSIRITANWRIIFRFIAGSAEEVDLVDYH